MTLVSGVYTSASSMGLTGTLTLDAAGDPNAAFVFQAGSTLTTASGSQVALINGAQACNVFWQVGSSATLGTGSRFRGTILALTDITVTTAATVDGRILARNGAVTLDTNTITRSTCATPATVAPTPASYPANVGPGAQGLVCPWGGVYDGVGLCVGTGDNPLMNPSPTSTTPVATAATPAPSATPAVTAASPTPSATPTASKPAPGPSHVDQVPKKPSGGVGTGDSTTG
jgi:type VI secretion system secreted protein VgrG